MNWFKNNKKFIIFYLFFITIGTIVIVFTCNNHKFYKDIIARVIKTEEKYVEANTISHGYSSDLYEQTIIVKVLNGEYKGKELTLKNEFHTGLSYSEKYIVGDELFISLSKEDKEINDIFIEGYKRDKYLVTLIVVLILTLILVGRLKGFLSIISVIINIFIFSIIARLHFSGFSLPVLCFISSIIFSSISLLLVSGFNKKTISAIISSILGITAVMLITLIVINITNYGDIRFEQMELVSGSYKSIFIAELILCGLGAIMDIAVSISSSLNELLEKDNSMSKKALIKSGFTIGKDIMSTMINVMFFTCICTSIPNLVIFFRNGIEINFLIKEYISLEMSRALISAIGIVITIPISIYISANVLKRGDKND